AEFAAALKLPRATEAEEAVRTKAMQKAARRAAEVPMETVEASLAAVAAAESLVGRCNVNAQSDLGVAALLGEAAAHGAARNVLVNLPSVGDEVYAGEMTARVMSIVRDIEELAASAHEAIRRGETRAR